MSFDLSLIAVSLPKILQGLGLTLNLLAVSTLFGLILAVGILLMRLSRRAWLVWPAKAYIYFFRGTPLLVQLFVIYHGLPQFGFIRQSVLWPLLREPYWCSVIALSLNTAAYVSEILRGGVLGVDKGLIEAGKALGLSKFQRTSRITAPLAVRLALPAYSNEIVSMLKSTALASTVTLMEMTGVARTIVADTFAPYEIFIAATIIYLVLVWIIQTGFTLVETYANRHVRKT
ncbi:MULTISPECIES: ABC transporter permease [Shinella]|jgi:octopine/nopaline transport system permease protein|uniref:Amino acid ABC transporter membrane protein 2 (PAAT family) n=1 Tax=Shinella granuli TaxID=323621 RepID=A0A4R2CRQ3_SHIGR|nr:MULTISPECIES: ABC transporter permease [Shinella]CAI0341536.1 Octopine transport system permease protein OccM [Rhizobiaceae bacterium]CAK7261161.1 Octopine transport system permease protein OccM [Shinella sp. WSC3-e]MCO5141153.1 ABC transporter permease [Shinella sp.]MCW5711426.1 ABC transporter permease [Shinella sp.]MDC7260012.1 ABC transporter permease [Shinella sp. YE25]